MIEPAELRAAVFRSQLANFPLIVVFSTLAGEDRIVGRDPTLDEVAWEVELTPDDAGIAFPVRICADRILTAEPARLPTLDATLAAAGFGPGRHP